MYSDITNPKKYSGGINRYLRDSERGRERKRKVRKEVLLGYIIPYSHFASWRVFQAVHNVVVVAYRVVVRSVHVAS